ncbi:MAG: hypothetical protein WB767_11745 [Nocardioides sp.]
MSPRLSRLCVPVLGCALGWGLAGCSEAEVTAPPTTSSPAATPSTPTTSAAPEPESSAEPAAGILLEQDSVTVNMPEGWKLTENQSSFMASGLPPAEQDGLMTLSQLPALDSGVPEKRIEQIIARDSRGKRTEVLDPLDVNGVRMIHVVRYDSFTTDEIFAAIYDGDLINITVKVDKKQTNTAREEAVASVLASVVWR